MFSFLQPLLSLFGPPWFRSQEDEVPVLDPDATLSEPEPPAGFSLRRAELEDIPTLLELERISGYEDLFEKDDFHHMLNHPRRYRIMLAHWEGEVIGYLCATRQNKGWIIESLTVRPTHRHEGFGSRLLDYLKDLYPLRPEYKLAVVVRESDKGAQLFLKSNAFKCIGYGGADFQCPPEPALLFLWERVQQ